MPDWLLWWRKYLQAAREARVQAQERAAREALRRWHPEVQRGRRFLTHGRGGSVQVDVVEDHGLRWVKVVSAKPFGLASNNWTGQSRSGQRKKQGLREHTEKMLSAARANTMLGRPPRVVVRFTRGTSPAVAQALREMGAEAEGDIAEPPRE